MPRTDSLKVYQAVRAQQDPRGELVRQLVEKYGRAARPVTPDERRAPVGPRDYLAAHRDQYVLVFSHHTSGSMTNLRPDPARPAEKRHGGDELAALLGRHPNVLVWINGHTHRNRVDPRGGYWEVNTASHVDYPQPARVIELVDNHDGTLSLITTLIESAAPPRTDRHDLSPTGLAALYRELAYNAPGATIDHCAGRTEDRNTELLLRKR